MRRHFSPKCASPCCSQRRTSCRSSRWSAASRPRRAASPPGRARCVPRPCALASCCTSTPIAPCCADLRPTALYAGRRSMLTGGERRAARASGERRASRTPSTVSTASGARAADDFFFRRACTLFSLRRVPCVCCRWAGCCSSPPRPRAPMVCSRRSRGRARRRADPSLRLGGVELSAVWVSGLGRAGRDGKPLRETQTQHLGKQPSCRVVNLWCHTVPC